MFEKITESSGAALMHQTVVATDDMKAWHELERLRTAHISLDQQIRALAASRFCDPFATQQMKREKLRLKELIYGLESALYPDLIA
jgi:hypothetical protein